MTPEAHIEILRSKISKIRSTNFSYDLLDIVNRGEENANDTNPADCGEGITWGVVAIRTIGGLLCERDLALPRGSNEKRVRDWFFRNGVSF